MHALNAVNSTSTHELQTDTKMLPMEIGMLLVNTGTGGAMRQCCPVSLPFNCGEICKKENTYTPLQGLHTIFTYTSYTIHVYI